ncbi:alpha/beta hydrolase fold domain-containing protein [Echinicola sp. CAU 1574]|uniref:Pectinesterase n=1 Tax=Echinicola arenosa TaxID=2774144 RepID=A0ABR9AP86_9BACT|nr:pectinesterase family protein [Echinicola arenosa]MBD8490588.1 alpha/beta hydrolase fold domain-containing protein [Echinicola arenosa]
MNLAISLLCRKSLVLVIFLISTLSHLSFSQQVNSYPKDGKIKDLKGKVQEDIVVAKDGSGDFLYIADALEAIRVYLPKPITVYIKEGVYKEKLEIPGTITNVTFKGDGPDKTIITFDDHTGKNYMDTFDSYTLLVWGNSLIFRDLTIQNTAGSVGQAVALHAEGDRLVFENCHIKGDQDTMFASGENSRQYYKDCYIEGTTDFIFGSATALFEKCEIYSKTNSYITAASTPNWVDYGYVFNGCKLTAAEGVNRVFLGRPWRDYAQTVFIDCEMGDHIVPEGWHNWGSLEKEKTTYYAEYNSIGPGANMKSRVGWAHELTDEEALAFTKENIFKGSGKSINAYGFAWYGYEKDTSFTLNSSYKKYSKNLPDIQPVYAASIGGVQEEMNIPYKKLGYRELKLDVFCPENQGTKTIPGILFVHGGGWKSGDRSLQIPLAKALAAKGYITAVMDYRLSLEAPYPAGVHDVKDAIKWIKDHANEFNVDTTRIAISGGSAGGQLAALVGTTNGMKKYESDHGDYHSSADVQAIIDMDGVLAFHHPESSEGTVAAEWLGGTSEEVPEVWDEASALYQVSDRAVPVLFLNSQYPRFHAGQDDMIQKLDQLGIYSEVHSFPNSPHPYWLFEPWFTPTVNLTDKFLRKIW